MGSTHGRFVKALLGILMLIGFISFLLVGVLERAESQTKNRVAGSSRHMKVVIREEKFGFRPQADVNYMSKRRVPNGSDPIHNRKAGNSRRPPGQA